MLQSAMEWIPPSETASAMPATALPQHTAGMRREGEFYTIIFDGQICRLKDSKGLRYLEHLLGHPGSEFHVLDLVRRLGPPEDAGVVRDLRPVGFADPPILDARAKDAYRRRLHELREQLDEAEALNDIGRVGGLRFELEALTEQLAGAVGLGGRNRVAATASERARSTVTQRLKNAMRKIDAHAPILGDYLRRAVRTGTFCAYLPGIAQVVRWNLE
jgi:non-specific serine/threonine protein kinase